MDILNILQLNTSFQRNTWAGITEEISIADVLNRIKSDKHENEIFRLRELLRAGKSESYGIYKKLLPCVTFCGTFKDARKKELLKNYNYVIVIDIDKLDEEEFNKVRNLLDLDEYVISFWESPSGSGFKGLIKVDYDVDVDNSQINFYHSNAFREISIYFENRYNISLDDSGSDTTRLCFLSHDKNLKIKSTAKAFVINSTNVLELNKKIIPRSFQKKEAFSRHALYNPNNKNKPIDRKIIQSIIKFLTKRKLSITYDYEEWYRVAFAISNTFTYEIGEKYFISLCKLDTDKFNETNCKNMLNYAYLNSSGKIKFTSLIYYANQKGYLTNSQKREVSKAGS